MIGKKRIVLLGIALAGIMWGGYTVNKWGKNTIGYESLDGARKKGKACYVKGAWEKTQAMEKKVSYFSFYLKDDNGDLMKVIYDKGMPNNFEQASSVVVHGRVDKNILYAKNILVKCPSKYQSEKANQSLEKI